MKSEPLYSQLDYQDRQTIAIGLEQGHRTAPYADHDGGQRQRHQPDTGVAE